MSLRPDCSKNTPFYSSVPINVIQSSKFQRSFFTLGLQKKFFFLTTKSVAFVFSINKLTKSVLGAVFCSIHVFVSSYLLYLATSVVLGLDGRECWCGSWEQVFVQFSKEGKGHPPPSPLPPCFHQISTPADSQYHSYSSQYLPWF